MVRAMFEPMTAVRVDVFGIPAVVVLGLLGLAGLVIGFFWIRRITGGDPEIQSFLATADRSRGPSVTLILGTALLGIGLMAIGMLTVTTGSTSVDPDPTNAVPTWLIVAGIVVDAAAVGLVVLRRWASRRV